jgi:hypothetical protein
MCFPMIIFIHLSFPLQEDACFNINLHPHIFDKSLQLNLLFIFKFTFVEVSIALGFYFQIWDPWESKYYLKLDISPLSSSILFHCAYICSPTTIASLNFLINLKFCLFYSHSPYTSLPSIDLNLVNTNGVSTFLSNFESVTKNFYKLKVLHN